MLTECRRSAPFTRLLVGATLDMQSEIIARKPGVLSPGTTPAQLAARFKTGDAELMNALRDCSPSAEHP